MSPASCLRRPPRRRSCWPPARPRRPVLPISPPWPGPRSAPRYPPSRRSTSLRPGSSAASPHPPGPATAGRARSTACTGSRGGARSCSPATATAALPPCGIAVHATLLPSPVSAWAPIGAQEADKEAVPAPHRRFWGPEATSAPLDEPDPRTPGPCCGLQTGSERSGGRSAPVPTAAAVPGGSSA
jgi:hypothetical protein